MLESAVWPHTAFTPYEVLGASKDASVAEVRRCFRRMALRTHPDKQIPNATPEASSSNGGCGRADYTFLEVKAATEVLLDPVLRAQYDLQLCQSMIRSCGACSDSYVLSEDFDEVELKNAEGEVYAFDPAGNSGDAIRVFQRECRCGGVYEVVIFGAAPHQGGSAQCHARCECDSCSLMVEVLLDAYCHAQPTPSQPLN